MVRGVIFLISLLVPVTAAAVNEAITADGLKRETMLMQARERKKGVSPSELRSMLGILDGKEAAIYYEHQGVTYPGVQLPDGTLAPAIVDHYGDKYPGCLANDGQVYPAVWSDDRLNCLLPKNANALIPVDNAVHVDRVDGRRGKPVLNHEWGSLNTDGNTRLHPTANTQAENVESDLGKPTSKSREGAAIKTGLSNTGSSAGDSNNVKVKSSTVGPKKTDHQHVKKESVSRAQTTKSSTRIARDVYNPPPRNTVSNTAKSYAVVVDKSNYGIRLGTWAKAEITRTVTNSDAGQVELTLVETVMGSYQSLPVGTILYGRKAFNRGTYRLDIEVARAITPEGDEFSLSGTVFSSNKEMSGLSGVLLRDRDKEFDRFAANAALRTAAVALNTVSPESQLAGAAYGSVVDDVIDTEQSYLRQQESAVIKVFPQQVFVRFDRTF